MAELKYEDRPWTKWYSMLGLPEELPEVKYSLIESIYKVWGEKVPRDRIAIVCEGYEMTAEDFIDKTKRFISAMRGLGLGKGDVVATLMPSGIPIGVCMPGIIGAGMTWQPISALQKKPEIYRQLREGRAKTIICSDKFLDTINEIKDKVSLEHIIVSSEKDFTSGQDEKVIDPPGAVQFRNLLERHEPAEPVFDLKTDDTVILIFTGGATGVPKGVQLTLGNINFYERLLVGLMGEPLLDAITGHAAILSAQHMYHIGLVTYMLGLRLGCTTYIVPDPRDSRKIYEYLQKPGVVLNLSAPGQLVKISELEGVDLKKIGHVITLSGIASISPEVDEKYAKKTGAGSFQGYGQTESAAIISANLPGALSLLGLGNPSIQRIMGRVMPYLMPIVKGLGPSVLNAIGMDRLLSLAPTAMRTLMTVGRVTRNEEKRKEDLKPVGIPVWNTDIKIVDFEDQKKIVPVGEAGELCFKGIQRMKGYLPTEDGYSGSGIDDEGFVHTGDGVVMDEDGILTMVDRTKDMINVSGFKVYGRTVEDVVYAHPAVSECAAIAVPDEKDPMNERVKLVVQLKEGVEPGKKIEDEIMQMCRDNLAPYAVPRHFEFMEEVPIMHTEKVDKKLLRGMHKEKMKRAKGE